jgi:hypothetical protein
MTDERGFLNRGNKEINAFRNQSFEHAPAAVSPFVLSGIDHILANAVNNGYGKAHMRCPDCGIEIGSLPCWRCERSALDQEWNYKSLIKDFSLVRGAPTSDSQRASLKFAVKRIEERLAKSKHRGGVSYKEEHLLHCADWWYIPYTWIGCSGFIVNTKDGYVNWLGSGLITLQEFFWGHNRGIFCDLVDFEFASNTDKSVAAKLLEKFQHMHPNARGVLPQCPVWYRDSEIPSALSSQFPIFKHHCVWPAIPDLFQACKEKGLRFTCRLSINEN